MITISKDNKMQAPSLDEEQENSNIVATVDVADSANRSIANINKNRILALVESRALIQCCLGLWLEEDFKMFRLLTFSSLAEAAHRLNNDQPVDLILWSVGDQALSQLSALEDLQEIKATFPDVPIALLADRQDVADVAEAIRGGANGYIPTSLEKREIAEILRFVLLGGTYVPPGSILATPSSGLDDQSSSDPLSPFGGLTPRELKVVDLLRQAKSNKVIAYELDLSENTVKVIVHRILNKLNAANRTEVACLALKYLDSQSPSMR